MAESEIEWTDKVWNPVTGCTPVSPGCAHCYAGEAAKRFWADRKFSDVQCHPDRLRQPLRWRKPWRVFVDSMGDLFHEDVPRDFIDRVFGVMALAGYTRARRNTSRQERRHTFQVLTKRSAGMRTYLSDPETPHRVWVAARKLDPHGDGLTVYQRHLRPAGPWSPTQELVPPEWPLPWVQLGVSCENQHTLDLRVPELLQTPAAVRFVSLEPLLRLIDASWYLQRRVPFKERIDRGDPDWPELEVSFERGLDWVIVGGESGSGARPMDEHWVLSIRDQCQAAGVPFFYKQRLEGRKKVTMPELEGKVWAEYPECPV